MKDKYQKKSMENNDGRGRGRAMNMYNDLKSHIKYLYRRITVIQKDKLLHFIAGMLVAVIVLIVLPWWAALAAAVLAGAAKEIIDYYGYGAPELADFLYTALGGLIVCLPEIINTFL